MFTGIDEVDWTSLRHAYGSARDVPGLLRGLASAEPVERAAALDRMYGAVHHEGRVYDSTLACVPFLLTLAADGRVRERSALVELLVSIGEGEPGEGVAERAVAGDEVVAGDDVRAQTPVRAEAGVRAGAEVRAGAQVFIRLIGDPDPTVRRAAVAAVVRFVDEPPRALALLRERLSVERDDRLVIALVEGLGDFARRHPGHAAEAVELLAAQSGPPYGPGPRLAALGQLAACAPARLPADLVPEVLGLLGERSAHRPCLPGAAGASAVHSLVARLRRLRPTDEEGGRLLRTLHTALDDRLPDRIALLEGQLTSADPAERCNAVLLAGALFREWRGDYGTTVELIGEQLRPEEGEDEGRLRDTAVAVLADLFTLAAPAADRLHALVAARPDRWVRRWRPEPPLLGGPLRALARSGDARAVPVLAEVLTGPVVPRDLGAAVVDLGAAAAPLAPLLCRALAAVPLDSPGPVVPLLDALGALRDPLVVPEALRRLQSFRNGAGAAHDGSVRPALEALGAVGAAAHEAAPTLRGLLGEPQSGGPALPSADAVSAADALWAVEGDASAVLPVLLRELTHADPRQRARAARSLSKLGPGARPALPALRRTLAAEGTTGGAAVTEAAAYAICAVTGEAEPAVARVLRSAWADRPRSRAAVAACLSALGAAAAPLRDLAETELAAPRRHTARSGGRGSHDIADDETLLRLCRRVVEGDGDGA
ncbi:HEAT repeat domain-containing protein [Streptomyces hayashii]|uniref:HEAT repeat domain-containing protein n=1 Tax=Streptomyces hayashii TaxID=2839966 RepID=UPI00403C4761